MSTMGTTLEPIMEPVSVPGHISGSGIIADLCRRIAEKLALDCQLRASDAYGGYALTAEIALQLHDVDTTPVNAAIQVGSIDPAQPVQRITLGSTVSAAEVAEEPAPLERSVDGELPEPVKKRDAQGRWLPRG